jgi:uncharacterized membrane protein YeiH
MVLSLYMLANGRVRIDRGLGLHTINSKRGARMNVLHTVALHAVLAIGDAPPGSEKFTMIIKWVLWICNSLVVIAFMIIGAQLAMAIRRGDSGQHVAALGSAMAGAVIIGVASALATALIG